LSILISAELYTLVDSGADSTGAFIASSAALLASTGFTGFGASG